MKKIVLTSILPMLGTFIIGAGIGQRATVAWYEYKLRDCTVIRWPSEEEVKREEKVVQEYLSNNPSACPFIIVPDGNGGYRRDTNAEKHITITTNEPNERPSKKTVSHTDTL